MKKCKGQDDSRKVNLKDTGQNNGREKDKGRRGERRRMKEKRTGRVGMEKMWTQARVPRAGVNPILYLISDSSLK